MSSGFVSGGTSDAPIERSDEWLAAQLELEATRRRKADEVAAQNSGRSLFETLEANKVAKQEAFEEANRLKNQFRSLDDDEIDFLDSVLESTRREEARVKQETREGLDVFRKRQEELDKASMRDTDTTDTTAAAAEDEWATAAKKRKRVKEGVLKGVKLRKSSTADSAVGKQVIPAEKPVAQAENAKAGDDEGKTPIKPLKDADTAGDQKSDIKAAAEANQKHGKNTESKPTLGLVDYGSDDEW